MTNKTVSRVVSEPLAVSIPEAARLLSVSRQFIYKLINAGTLRRVKIGRSARIPMSEIWKLLDANSESSTDQ
jgi:excisionase family DNA binding protein